MSKENGTKRHVLTASQAQVLAEIEMRKRAVKKEWDVAVTLVGLDPAKVVGGELIKEPHLLVAE
jgi:hypothetical protein